MGSESVSDVYMYIFINCNCSWFFSFFNLIYTCTDVLFLLVDVKVKTQCFSVKFWKNVFIIFSFLLKRSFQGIFSCLEILNGSA